MPEGFEIQRLNAIIIRQTDETKDSKTLVLAHFWALFLRGKSAPPEAGQSIEQMQAHVAAGGGLMNEKATAAGGGPL